MTNAMTPETIARARWERAAVTDDASAILKARKQDGGAVLAKITPRYDRGYLVGYTWETADQSGETPTIGMAQLRARKALREKALNKPQQAPLAPPGEAQS